MTNMGNSGYDNNDLMENVMAFNLIRSQSVERVFRVLDPADYLFYMMPEDSDQAFKVSAICIYSQAMDRLELHPGLSFLNVGSSTGYLSTLVGLIIGSSGINHGIELLPAVVDNATMILNKFIENSPALDRFDFCEPKYYRGNGLCLAPLQAPYDRVYCETSCPEGYQNYFKQLLKVGGILVMPLNNHLLQIRRLSETEWVSRCVLDVSLARFATLCVPTNAEAAEPIRLDEQCPPNLQLLARSVIRSAMRAGLLRRHPKLREPPINNVLEELKNFIHDSDDGVFLASMILNLVLAMEHERVGSAREVNAVLSLLIRMGKNEGDDKEVNAVLCRLFRRDLNPMGNESNMQAFVSLVLSMSQNRSHFSSEEVLPRGFSLEEAEGEEDESEDDDGGGSGSSAGGGSPRSAESPPSKSSETDRASSPSASAAGSASASPGKHKCRTDSKGSETDLASSPSASAAGSASASPGKHKCRTDSKSSETDRASSPSASAAGSASASPGKHKCRTDSKGSETDLASSPSASAAGSASASPGKHKCRTDSKSSETDRASSPSASAAGSASASPGKHKCRTDSKGSETDLASSPSASAAGSASASPGKHKCRTDSKDDEDEDSSDEETQEETNTRKETTPTSDSSPLKSDSETDDSHGDGSRRSDSLTDDMDDTQQTSRRPKRRRLQSPRAGAHSSRPSGSGAPCPCQNPAPQRDPRYERLYLGSIVMQRGIEELPLPSDLKKFVNLGRGPYIFKKSL